MFGKFLGAVVGTTLRVVNAPLEVFDAATDPGGCQNDGLTLSQRGNIRDLQGKIEEYFDD